MCAIKSVFVPLYCFPILIVFGGLLCGTLSSSIDVTPSGDVNRQKDNDEKRVLDYITRGYDRDVRPVYNASTAVVIFLGITLTQIFDMDEKNQVLTTNVWLDQEWMDELLAWDPEQFHGVKEIRVPCEKIWLPDIVLYNNADDYTRGFMQSKAMVNHKGRVFWPPPTKFRSTCAVDVTYFPFDDQTCTMKLGSWTYNGYEVDVTNRSEEVDLSNYVNSGEWELLQASVQRNVVYYSCCPEPFPDVTITLTIRRKTLFYMYNIVLPCMMMSVLTLLVFCMPPESGEKIALGVTVLLAFSVFMLAIAEKMPETSDNIPLIGIYLTTVMAITSVSIIMTVVVLNLHYHGPSGKEAPKWIRRIALKRNFRSLHKRHHPLHNDHGKGRSLRRRAAHDSLAETRLQDSPIRHMFPTAPPAPYLRKCEAVRLAVNGLQSHRGEVPTTGTPGCSGAYGTLYGGDYGGAYASSCGGGVYGGTCGRVYNRACYEGAPGLSGDSGPTSPDEASTNSTAQHYGFVDGSGVRYHHRVSTRRPSASMANGAPHGQDDVSRAIRQLLGRQETDVADGKKVSDWRHVALAADRVLFWVFLVVTTVSSLVFLVLLPIYKRSQFQRPD